MFHSKLITYQLCCERNKIQQRCDSEGPMLCLYESYYSIFHYKHTQVRFIHIHSTQSYYLATIMLCADIRTDMKEISCHDIIQSSWLRIRYCGVPLHWQQQIKSQLTLVFKPIDLTPLIHPIHTFTNQFFKAKIYSYQTRGL
jgi:hypothetical protein